MFYQKISDKEINFWIKDVSTLTKYDASRKLPRLPQSQHAMTGETSLSMILSRQQKDALHNTIRNILHQIQRFQLYSGIGFNAKPWHLSPRCKEYLLDIIIECYRYHFALQNLSRVSNFEQQKQRLHQQWNHAVTEIRKRISADLIDMLIKHRCLRDKLNAKITESYQFLNDYTTAITDNVFSAQFKKTRPLRQKMYTAVDAFAHSIMHKNEIIGIGLLTMDVMLIFAGAIALYMLLPADVVLPGIPALALKVTAMSLWGGICVLPPLVLLTRKSIAAGMGKIHHFFASKTTRQRKQQRRSTRLQMSRYRKKDNQGISHKDRFMQVLKQQNERLQQKLVTVDKVQRALRKIRINNRRLDRHFIDRCYAELEQQMQNKTELSDPQLQQLNSSIRTLFDLGDQSQNVLDHIIRAIVPTDFAADEQSLLTDFIMVLQQLKTQPQQDLSFEQCRHLLAGLSFFSSHVMFTELQTLLHSMHSEITAAATVQTMTVLQQHQAVSASVSQNHAALLKQINPEERKPVEPAVVASINHTYMVLMGQRSKVDNNECDAADAAPAVTAGKHQQQTASDSEHPAVRAVFTNPELCQKILSHVYADDVPSTILKNLLRFRFPSLPKDNSQVSSLPLQDSDKKLDKQRQFYAICHHGS